MRTTGASKWEEIHRSLSYILDRSTHQKEENSTKMTQQNLRVLTGNASSIGHGYATSWENGMKGNVRLEVKDEKYYSVGMRNSAWTALFWKLNVLTAEIIEIYPSKQHYQQVKLNLRAANCIPSYNYHDNKSKMSICFNVIFFSQIRKRISIVPQPKETITLSFFSPVPSLSLLSSPFV